MNTDEQCPELVGVIFSALLLEEKHSLRADPCWDLTSGMRDLLSNDIKGCLA